MSTFKLVRETRKGGIMMGAISACFYYAEKHDNKSNCINFKELLNVLYSIIVFEFLKICKQQTVVPKG
jgi:hypothetical protein